MCVLSFPLLCRGRNIFLRELYFSLQLPERTLWTDLGWSLLPSKKGQDKRKWPSSYIREGLDWTSEEIPLLKGRSSIGTGFPLEQWNRCLWNVQNTCGCAAWRHGLVENLGAELMVELDGLQGLFQPKCFCDSIRTWEVCKARHLAITL